MIATVTRWKILKGRNGWIEEKSCEPEMYLILSIYTHCAVCSAAPSSPALCDPTDHRPPGSSVHGIFPRQEYWTGLRFPSPGYLPHPGTEPTTPALAGGVFTSSLRGSPYNGILLSPPGYLPDLRIKPTSHVSCIGRQVLHHQHLGTPLYTLCSYNKHFH